jgi:multidrug efflux pump subunit AcrB
MAQLEQPEREDPRDLLELYVRGNKQELIPLASVIDTRDDRPARDSALRSARSAMISADLATRTQGEASRRCRSRAKCCPRASSGSWGKRRSSSRRATLLFAYGLAIVVVFPVLAAQFESFVHPVTILVAVAPPSRERCRPARDPHHAQPVQQDRTRDAAGLVTKN